MCVRVSARAIRGDVRAIADGCECECLGACVRVGKSAGVVVYGCECERLCACVFEFSRRWMRVCVRSSAPAITGGCMCVLASARAITGGCMCVRTSAIADGCECECLGACVRACAWVRMRIRVRAGARAIADES